MNIIEKIKKLDLTNYRQIRTIFKDNPDIEKYCQNLVIQYPNLISKVYALYYINSNKKDMPKCKTCGKYLNYKKYVQHHSEFCSTKCISKEKSRKTNLIEKYNKLKENFKDYVIPLFSADEYNGRANTYKWKCIKCGNIFESNITQTTHFQERKNIKLKRLPRCLKCYPLYGNTSNLEKQVYDFCLSRFNSVKHNDKTLIKPYELDIAIPEIKLAIEFNGLYYHCIDHIGNTNYHLMKTQMCEKIGYRLIHIWEDEWINNREEIKRKLIDIFENKEFVDYNIILDRCWYQAKEIIGYKLKILPSEIIQRSEYKVLNCGYLKYERIVNKNS